MGRKRSWRHSPSWGGFGCNHPTATRSWCNRLADSRAAVPCTQQQQPLARQALPRALPACPPAPRRLNLEDCRNTVIGSAMARGVSGGEVRRAGECAVAAGWVWGGSGGGQGPARSTCRGCKVARQGNGCGKWRLSQACRMPAHSVVRGPAAPASTCRPCPAASTTICPPLPTPPAPAHPPSPPAGQALQHRHLPHHPPPRALPGRVHQRAGLVQRSLSGQGGQGAGGWGAAGGRVGG